MYSSAIVRCLPGLILVAWLCSNGRAAAASAPPFKVEKGAKCTLNNALSGSVKSGKKPGPVTIPAAASVVISEVSGKGEATVAWNGDSVDVGQKDLETFCEVAAAAPEKIAPT